MTLNTFCLYLHLSLWRSFVRFFGKRKKKSTLNEKDILVVVSFLSFVWDDVLSLKQRMWNKENDKSIKERSESKGENWKLLWNWRWDESKPTVVSCQDSLLPSLQCWFYAISYEFCLDFVTSKYIFLFSISICIYLMCTP